MTDSKTLTIVHFLINQNDISDLERELVGLLGCVRPDGLHLSQGWGREPGSVKPGTGTAAHPHLFRNVTLSPCPHSCHLLVLSVCSPSLSWPSAVIQRALSLLKAQPRLSPAPWSALSCPHPTASSASISAPVSNPCVSAPLCSLPPHSATESSHLPPVLLSLAPPCHRRWQNRIKVCWKSLWHRKHFSFTCTKL